MKHSENKNSKKLQLLPGAGVFLFIVVYVNIRHNHEIDIIDWTVITCGVIFFIFALLKHYKDKKTTKWSFLTASKYAPCPHQHWKDVFFNRPGQEIESSLALGFILSVGGNFSYLLLTDLLYSLLNTYHSVSTILILLKDVFTD